MGGNVGNRKQFRFRTSEGTWCVNESGLGHEGDTAEGKDADWGDGAEAIIVTTLYG